MLSKRANSQKSSEDDQKLPHGHGYNLSNFLVHLLSTMVDTAISSLLFSVHLAHAYTSEWDLFLALLFWQQNAVNYHSNWL